MTKANFLVTRLLLVLLVAVGLAAGATSCGSNARVDPGDADVADMVDVALPGISFGDDGFGGCLTFCPKPSIVVPLSCPIVVAAVNTSGPCVGTFGCTAKSGGPCLTFAIQVSGTDAGVCQVVVMAGDASSYMANVTFQQEPASECCPAGLSPMPVGVSIDDSASGCAYYASAAADASREAGGDASIAKDGSMEVDAGGATDASTAATDAGEGSSDATSVSDAPGDR